MVIVMVIFLPTINTTEIQLLPSTRKICTFAAYSNRISRIRSYFNYIDLRMRNVCRNDYVILEKVKKNKSNLREKNLLRRRE